MTFGSALNGLRNTAHPPRALQEPPAEGNKALESRFPSRIARIYRAYSLVNGRYAAEAVVQKFVISIQYTWVGFTGHRKIDVLMASLSLAGAEVEHKTFHDSRRSLPMPSAMKTVPQVIKTSATLNEYGLLIPQQLILR